MEVNINKSSSIEVYQGEFWSNKEIQFKSRLIEGLNKVNIFG